MCLPHKANLSTHLWSSKVNFVVSPLSVVGAQREYILGGKRRCDSFFFALFSSPFSMFYNFLYSTYLDPLLCELVLPFKCWFRPSLALHLEAKEIVEFNMC